MICIDYILNIDVIQLKMYGRLLRKKLNVKTRDLNREVWCSVLGTVTALIQNFWPVMKPPHAFPAPLV